MSPSKAEASNWVVSTIMQAVDMRPTFKSRGRQLGGRHSLVRLGRQAAGQLGTARHPEPCGLTKGWSVLCRSWGHHRHHIQPLEHLHNVKTQFCCPRAFLGLYFPCRDDGSGFGETFGIGKSYMQQRWLTFCSQLRLSAEAAPVGILSSPQSFCCFVASLHCTDWQLVFHQVVFMSPIKGVFGQPV